MSAPRPVRVVVTDDHEVAVAGFRALLERHPEQVVVVDVRVVGERAAEVILFEPEGQSDATRRALRDLVRDSGARSSAYTWNDARTQRNGHSGVGPRVPRVLTAAELVAAIEAVAVDERSPLEDLDDLRGDERELTPREAEILGLITRGLTNTEIATALYLSINSVKTYIRSGYRKIGVSRRTQAVAWGMAHGLGPDS
ncbi:response regulator transcription factor [Nocardioides sp. KIGAM211]|uniref:Response regulator transcription factor n=1 Tax=Nocardioides luti TaxID=2761101 RepID=A0A7X0RIQ2_9ACTN|nr:response regulator transcription factor [Nocardioides luti]